VYILGVRRVIVTAACRALAGVLVIGVVYAFFTMLIVARLPWTTLVDPQAPSPMMYRVGSFPYTPPAPPWWAYAVTGLEGLLMVAVAICLYRVAPRVVDRHVFIRRSTASSSL
jgi:hypothetical protein